MTQDFRNPSPFGASPMTGLPADFTAFHQRHRPAYVHWAELYLGNRADAEEAVDCAFEQLARTWQKVLAMENPAGYAWQVMKHRTIDAARARDRRPDLIDTAVFETTTLLEAVDPIGELEESLGLFHAIRCLPERQQDVVVLLYCRGYTTTEVADHLGITEAGVRSTARYAKRRLREALGLEKEGSADDLAR
ncbi:MAG TPA: sigma-70 family RNA polymerase sigma factor [Streptomyces sp.]|uniref:sigma-70 family RNA polymerase sigma factor n=1 Tax=Streptomyces sp. TaxID=1931 RepID=UPI002D2CD2E7|nr:sigma-70 family RNA polymerase sigma factor [Streptomyces sp.]HZG03965.1 sigma-70 family RNA polymerase sigma factor [Streptomyces sp.]